MATATLAPVLERQCPILTAEYQTMDDRHRSLISLATFHRVARRIAKDHQWSAERCGQATAAAVEFLTRCGENPDKRIPGILADAGWHAFLLHTRDYARFCKQFGRYIPHEPTTDDYGNPKAAADGTTCTTGSSDKDGEEVSHTKMFDGFQADCGETDCNSDGDA